VLNGGVDTSRVNAINASNNKLGLNGDGDVSYIQINGQENFSKALPSKKSLNPLPND
jgi:hypothetical protein